MCAEWKACVSLSLPHPAPPVQSGFVVPPSSHCHPLAPLIFLSPLSFSAHPCMSSLCADPEPCPVAHVLTYYDVPLKHFFRKKCFLFSVLFPPNFIEM